MMGLENIDEYSCTLSHQQKHGRHIHCTPNSPPSARHEYFKIQSSDENSDNESCDGSPVYHLSFDNEPVATVTVPLKTV